MHRNFSNQNAVSFCAAMNGVPSHAKNRRNERLMQTADFAPHTELWHNQRFQEPEQIHLNDYAFLFCLIHLIFGESFACLYWKELKKKKLRSKEI